LQYLCIRELFGQKQRIVEREVSIRPGHRQSRSIRLINQWKWSSDHFSDSYELVGGFGEFRICLLHTCSMRIAEFVRLNTTHSGVIRQVAA
jgi:hypothetical protein